MHDSALRRAIEAGETSAGPAAPARAPRPRVLLVTTLRWPTAALLAAALTDAGFEVGALCPEHHPLRAVRGLIAAPVYRHLSRHRRLARAIARVGPDIVVPCDDLAVTVLHEHHSLCRRAASTKARGALIEASLGDAVHFALLRSKSAFVAFAAANGVHTPKTTVVKNVADLRGRLDRSTFPVVVKADGWSGGRGTRIVRNAEEAVVAFETLARPMSWVSAVKDCLREASVAPVVQRFGGASATVTLQALAPGRPVNRAVVCRDGRVIAGRTFEAVETMPNNGNATVVRPRHIPQVDVAVERCVALLGLSGVVGFDFMYDEATDTALMLEVNPRATSACYTAPKGGSDLTLALHAALTGVPAACEPAPAGATLIALFPQELERDPHSRYLRDAQQQAPLGHPDLVQACLLLATRRSLYERIVGAIKGAGRAAAARVGVQSTRLATPEAP